MKKLLLLLCTVGTLALSACTDDNETSKLNSSALTQAEDYTDPRDGQVYHTVRVGNQLWMAQNLRYALPGYSLDGAYTYGETPIDKTTIKPDDADVLQVMTDLINDPERKGWPFKVGNNVTMTLARLFESQLRAYNSGRLTIDKLRSAIEGYDVAFRKDSVPSFTKLLGERLLRFAELPHIKAKVGRPHFESADEANGGFVRQYGFLYTYEGAKAAVPEGWRLPSDEDWIKLERAVGLSANEAQALNEWRGEGLATLLSDSQGFAAEKAGANTYVKAVKTLTYNGRGRSFYYWTSTPQLVRDSISTVIYRQSSTFNTKVWRGVTPTQGTYYPVLFSVRCVKDL